MKKITSSQNPLIKHLVKLQSKSYREKNGSVLVSGVKIIRELSKILTPSKILISKEIDFDIDSDIFLVTEEIIKKITKLPSHEGIVAEFSIPKSSSLENVNRLLACDMISDPGNLGTLLRSALAFGFEGVFLLHHSCDLFNDKVIRASRGASFLLPYRFGTFEELKNLASKNHLIPMVADLKGKEIGDVPLKEKLVLLLGNESLGPSVEAKNWGEKVTIKISDQMDSLNVAIAGSILMYALQNR